MAIHRSQLAYEGNFVQLPNQWMRDVRISRRARGLLAEIMTHRVGWKINQSSLEESGPEGREALNSAIKELKKFGYLKIQQDRLAGSNKFGEIVYVITDPFAEPVYGFPVERVSQSTVLPESGKPAPKNTSLLEDYVKEDQNPSSSEVATATNRHDVLSLLDLLDAEIIRNGGKPPARNKRNVDAARLLIDRDRIPVPKLQRIIRWSQQNEFWRTNILSMSKFREQYERLRLQSEAPTAPSRVEADPFEGKTRYGGPQQVRAS